MCGIVGFFCPGSAGKMGGELREAVSRLSHRGPDDEGLFLDEEVGIGLGHRRLAVLDPSPAGRQPMVDGAGHALIVYNGEAYNFPRLRKELETLGHQFSSRTDTEVILKAYLQWGTGAWARLSGMFAFAIWDKRTKTLLLVRDRLGIKPLYYTLWEGGLAFASELKGLMAFSRFRKEIDLDALTVYLHYQYVPAPRTIFRETFKLLPGQWAEFSEKGLMTHVYWSLPRRGEVTEGRPLRVPEALERLEELLKDSVRDRLLSDVPLGALLSGGMDSSLVVSLMQSQASKPVRTFTVGFSEAGYNEAPWAARVARHLGTEHTEVTLTPRDALEVVPRLPEIYDEPFADSSAIPTHLISHVARGSVTVALSGDGGDEQFAGYVRYWSTHSLHRALGYLPPFFQKAMSGVLGALSTEHMMSIYRAVYPWLPQRFQVANFAEKWQKTLALLGRNDVSELYRMTVCLWSREDLRELMGRELAQTRFEKAFLESAGAPLLWRLMHVDRSTYLPEAMLTKVDRASMAVGLEVRVPLLDHRLVEWTSGLPEGMMYSRGKGKLLLRMLLCKYVPPDLFERPKMGFGIPLDRWLRGELRELLLDYLSAERLRQEGLFEPRAVEQRIHEHLQGRCLHHHRLWALLMWEMWRERWLG